MKFMDYNIDTKDYYLGARFTKKEKNKLIDFCKKQKITMSKLIRKAIKEYVKEEVIINV